MGATCDDDARAMLFQTGLPVKRVIRAEPDCVLWVDRYGNAKTSYIQAFEKNGRWDCRVINTVSGFAA